MSTLSEQIAKQAEKAKKKKSSKKRDENGKWKKELQELFGNCDLDLMRSQVSTQKLMLLK